MFCRFFTRHSLKLIRKKTSLARQVRCFSVEKDVSSGGPDMQTELGPIPDPPEIFATGADSALQTTLTESLESVGLNTFTPSGAIRMLLCDIHSYTGLPWWEVIALGALAGRVIMLPFTIKQIKANDAMLKHMPMLEKFRQRMEEAKKSGDSQKMHMIFLEQTHFLQKNNIMTPKFLITMLPQMIYFSSYFFAVKGMADAGIASFKTGGALWFPDLTLPDPLFLLPILCCSTLVLVSKCGVEFASPEIMRIPAQRFLMVYGLPIFLLISMKICPFSTALFVYWCTSNIFSLGCALMFRQPGVRKMLKLTPAAAKSKNIV